MTGGPYFCLVCGKEIRPRKDGKAPAHKRIVGDKIVDCTGREKQIVKPKFNAEHGTAAGHKQHRKLNQKPCQECVRAYSEKSKEYYRQNPEARRRKLVDNRARRKALEELRQAHPGEFLRLLYKHKNAILNEEAS